MSELELMMPIVLILLRFFLFVLLPFVFISELLTQFKQPNSKEIVAKKRHEPESIIGKSRTVIGQSAPPVDKDTPKEKRIENADTFAHGESKKGSAAIPDDQLDEAFSNNEKLDIDIEIETHQDDDLTLEQEMEHEELMALTGDAESGVSLEQMNQTVETITNSAPTHQEQEMAAGVINRVLGTEMMQQVIDSIPRGESRIEQLLNECERRYEQTLPTKRAVAKKSSLKDFNIEDYIN